MNNNKIYVHTGSAFLKEIKEPFDKKAEDSPVLLLELLETVLNKPFLGLWACEYTPNAKYISAWEEWKATEKIKSENEDYFLFQLKETASLLTISSEKDYEDIDPELKNLNGLINWDKMAERYDAVEVTRPRGYWNSAHGASRYLESWDVPSIVVFKAEAIIVLNNNLSVKQEDCMTDLFINGIISEYFNSCFGEENEGLIKLMSQRYGISGEYIKTLVEKRKEQKYD